MELTQERQAELIRFTQELVRCPGFSGDEAKTAAAVTRQMKELGYDKVEVDRWGNVIGTICGARPGPTIVFDGHMDVVPIRMPELWEHEPYGGEISDGKIWGRGTTDMKGGLAACLCAAAFVDRANIAGTILVTATVAEELVIGRGLGKVLEGRKDIATRLWVAPPTKMDASELMKEGHYSTLGGAGARMEMPGCSLCMGNQAQVKEGASVVSTSTRNFPNRLGRNANVYLASAELAAVASKLGRIPTLEEYRAETAAVASNAETIYRYMNFDRIQDYVGA